MAATKAAPAPKAPAKAAPAQAPAATATKAAPAQKVTATGEAKARGKTGATLGMSVKQTWAHIFSNNEDWKWTDEQISDFIKTEFPRTDGTPYPIEYEPDGIARVRTYYNNGMGDPANKPEIVSHKYDDQGNIIGGPRGTMTAIREAAKAERAAAEAAQAAPAVTKAAPARAAAPAAKAAPVVKGKGAPVARK